MFVKSTDGGQSFSKQQVSRTVVDIPSPLPGSSFRNDSFPSVDIDQTSGKVYVAWADFRNGRGQVMLTTSSDGGGNWTPAAKVLDVAGRSPVFPGVAGFAPLMQGGPCPPPLHPPPARPRPRAPRAPCPTPPPPARWRR